MASEDSLSAQRLVQRLVGQSLVQLCVGAGDAQLHFTGDIAIALGSSMRVGESGDAVPYTLDGLSLLLPLLNGDVTAVGLTDSGDLFLTVDGTTVCCGSDPHYEAWNYAGPAGERVVSMPGGGLAVWGPR